MPGFMQPAALDVLPIATLLGGEARHGATGFGVVGSHQGAAFGIGGAVLVVEEVAATAAGSAEPAFTAEFHGYKSS